MFPHITNQEDFIEQISHHKSIAVKVHDNGCTVVCYMIQDGDTFKNVMSPETECRGITFYDGKIAARTMHKFFNLGERPETMPGNLDFSKVSRVMLKRDGSMITPVVFNNFVACKTKKSFETREAQLAQKLMEETPGGIEYIKNMAEKGFTITFEVTSPSCPIVILYDKDEVTILHIRHNNTGEYLSIEQIRETNPPFNIVEDQRHAFPDFSWETLQRMSEETQGIEGWIIQFENGDMIKLKTKWYLELHHSIVFTRERDIARSILLDQGDDLKSAFTLGKRSLQPIIDIENRIWQEIDKIKQEVQDACKEKLTQKEYALKYKGHKYFSLIMRQMRYNEGSSYEPDFVKYYMDNFLDTYSLAVIQQELE